LYIKGDYWKATFQKAEENARHRASVIGSGRSNDPKGVPVRARRPYFKRGARALIERQSMKQTN